jgi:hypothetical protein
MVGTDSLALMELGPVVRAEICLTIVSVRARMGEG